MDIRKIELDFKDKSILFTRQDEDEIGGLELVDPNAFIESPLTDTIEINGYNVKELAIQ